MATHDLDLVKRADCRVIEMNRGQIVFDSLEDRARESEASL
jgi:ABC-type ATPase involved in cell division